jgi:long-chain acyl-CoA synthetase
VSLLARLARRVRQQPGAEALVHGAQRVTYDGLWSAIGGVSTQLRALRLPRGARIGLLLENSPCYAACYYAVHAVGGVVVPLNPAARASEIAGHLNHCAASALIIAAGHPELDALRGAAPNVQVLEAEALCSVRARVAFIEPVPEAPACIIYTSGTTGRPKGVTLSHRNLDINTRSILAYLPLSPADCLVNVLPFHYAYGNSILHTHLIAGARLVLDRSMVYPQGVLQGMEVERATGFSGVPSTFALLLARADPAAHDLRSLRYLTQAGGGMSTGLAQRVRKAFPRTKLFIMYGQTEASARLAYLPPERLDDKPGAVGIAIPGVELTIHDELGHEVPPGVTGEIWARGENVMLGYWNDPEATRQVMEHGWLKTGDLAHRDSDGYIYIDGRRSEMIKCGAHRISPQEVEEVIAQLDGVDDVACTGIPDELLGQVVKAVIVQRKGGALSRQAVQRHCRERLPPYKIPRAIAFVEVLPRTASGKVQRYLLRDSDHTKGERDVSTGTDHARG